jgi:hypothetical protein
MGFTTHNMDTAKMTIESCFFAKQELFGSNIRGLPHGSTKRLSDLHLKITMVCRIWEVALIIDYSDVEMGCSDYDLLGHLVK